MPKSNGNLRLNTEYLGCLLLITIVLSLEYELVLDDYFNKDYSNTCTSHMTVFYCNLAKNQHLPQDSFEVRKFDN